MLMYLHQPPTGRCGTPPRAWTLHPPMKRQRSLKVELVVPSPCHQIRGPTGRRRRRPFHFRSETYANSLGKALGTTSLQLWLAMITQEQAPWVSA